MAFCTTMERTFRKKRGINLGTGFSDSLDRNGPMEGNRTPSLPHRSVVGRLLLLLLFLGGFSLLSGRLYYLTVVRGSYYQSLSAENRTREERIAAPRGILYARDGSVLAANRPIYRQCDETKTVCRFLTRAAALEKEAAGESVEVVLGREYPEGPVAAHLTGYLSEITPEALAERNTIFSGRNGLHNDEFCQWCYGLGDYIGASGVEETLEDRLRGIPGKRLIEVDAVGIESKELVRVEPIPGENITLALDIQLQKAGISSLEKTLTKTGVGGAFIATKSDTGEVLAFYSAPSFDPNLFVFSDPKEIEEFVRENTTSDLSSLSEVLTDPKRPLFNRVIAGLYPPASTFKIITTTAGLEEGVLNEETKVEDTGVISLGKFSFSNWYFTQYGRTEGEIGIEQALARSNDIFFYKVGEWVGIDNLERWSRKFGLSKATGIELTGEEEGLIRRDREWYLGDTYHIAIGQGDLLATPIQVNSWTQTIANDGKKCRPTLLKIDPQKAECEDIGVDSETIRLINNGLIRACSDGGTGWPLFNFSVNTASTSASTRPFEYGGGDFISLENGGTKIQIACKTGTGEFGDPEHKTHAWLTAYAPAHDPEIVVTVLVEAGGEGSSIAAPIVKDILAEWFSKER
ncbi:MAG: Penicillin-binding protein 2 [Candidatus Roizmanbacteria bacterium GW2011_GWC2_41_7]|uniref:Penicillin-binding protein 2 n=1 Tax=Candidatus Roizmanbacteria bacterium GW2011_GWC2_41_7 TaxID=1618487 RepID=A0A0G1A7D5_9BACT|nr:MAG: Penicillin-binding protein 2 [Candidatus Roizmanbacteria bacterium GW2011_GWC2_41_7]